MITSSQTLGTTRGRFVARPIRHVGISHVNGWQLKRYEITVADGDVGASINAALNTKLERTLPQPRQGELGVGFLIVHHGTEAVWALADLWSGDIISQHTFAAPLANPTAFAAVPAGGPTACVHELPVHAHERNAFVANILNPLNGPDVSAYLADVGPVFSD